MLSPLLYLLDLVRLPTIFCLRLLETEYRDCHDEGDKIDLDSGHVIGGCTVSYENIADSIKMACDLLKKSSHQKSYELLKKIKGSGTQETDRLIGLARAEKRLGKLRDASETLYQASERDPWRTEVSFNLMCYYSLLMPKTNFAELSPTIERFVNCLFIKKASPEVLNRWLKALDSDDDLKNIRKSKEFLKARWQIDAMAKKKKIKFCIASKKTVESSGCRISYMGSCLGHDGKCEEGFDLSPLNESITILGCVTHTACME